MANIGNTLLQAYCTMCCSALQCILQCTPYHNCPGLYICSVRLASLGCRVLKTEASSLRQMSEILCHIYICRYNIYIYVDTNMIVCKYVYICVYVYTHIYGVAKYRSVMYGYIDV